MSDFNDIFARARFKAVRAILRNKNLFPTVPPLILDIACGQGRYTPLLHHVFPSSQIIGVDIAQVALQSVAKTYGENWPVVSTGEAIGLASDSIDMIFSIETLEHVLDVQATIREWSRVLKPGGKFLFTTPCANKFSLEWLMMARSGGLLPSQDGIGLFRCDDPSHLRRLTSRHVRQFFAEAGLTITLSRFRSHLFTTLARRYLFPSHQRLAHGIAALDWQLLRWLPNGASMVIVGEKPER